MPGIVSCFVYSVINDYDATRVGEDVRESNPRNRAMQTRERSTRNNAYSNDA
jgi:hypothetical protein